MGPCYHGGDECQHKYREELMKHSFKVVGGQDLIFLVFRVLLDQDWRWRRRKSIPVIKVPDQEVDLDHHFHGGRWRI